MLSDQNYSFKVQASQTTAQGLWIGAGIGVIMGTAIWFLGPPAMQGKAHTHASYPWNLC